MMHLFRKPAKEHTSVPRDILDAVEHCVSIAERHYRQTIPEFSLSLDLGGKSAGMVVFRRGARPLVRLNRILYQENRAHFLAQTIPHEIAHLVARTAYGSRIRPHGKEWKEVMVLFGIPARRCHRYDVSRAVTRRLRRYPYHCGCRQHQLTSIRHNRAQKGQTYLCILCRGELEPITMPPSSGSPEPGK
jgi:SprT protein